MELIAGCLCEKTWDKVLGLFLCALFYILEIMWRSMHNLYSKVVAAGILVAASLCCAQMLPAPNATPQDSALKQNVFLQDKFLILKMNNDYLLRDNQASSAVLKAYDRAQSSLAEEEGAKTLLKLISGAAYIIGTPVEKAANWHKK